MWRWINGSKSLSKPEPLQLIPKLCVATSSIPSVAWTLRKCSYSIVILSSAKFLSGIQCRNTNILPGFDNYKITTRRKKKTNTLRRPHSLFFFFFQTGDTTQLLQRGSDHVSPPSRMQPAASGGLRESFPYFQKEFDNSRITLQVMNTSKLVNKKLQLFLCLSENKI